MKKGYLIDLDGTMFRGSQACLGSFEWLAYLHANQIPFAFLTNNSSRTQSQARQHMESLGFTNLKDEHFFTSAMAASRYIAKHYTQRRAFVVGEAGLIEALTEMGFTLVEEEADFVFIGMNRQGTYEQYSQALDQVMKGAILVGTNNDRRIPMEHGFHVGNGSIVAMLEYASGQESIKVGKPHPPMMEIALDYLGLAREGCIMIGDNLETDILCGINAGMDTIMVLGGAHAREDVVKLDIHPGRIIDTLFDLLDGKSTEVL